MPETPVAQPGPARRSIRQVVIVAVAVIAAVPLALATVDVPDSYDDEVRLIVAICGAVVLVITAGLNAAEAVKGGPIIGAPHPLPPPEPIVRDVDAQLGDDAPPHRGR
jgi:hypothetical protein